ncbi:hypothetical protein M2277_005102 [Paenibacillus sp. LBL]|uniref:MarR family winged helix-turn-helix transcriptional regulator n=1 Tax=Paenibacillus sp. LBL TaxID=2940563 RepID=UPI002476B8A9|nr:MarR family winged helix-turn-helix transcriptional regulator [Paenibacillus sp. LBL]MDH6674410.1 hypothetical protein [Paenibacillus sp. LBL]
MVKSAGRPPIGFVPTWGDDSKNDFSILSDVVFYIRHIGIEHGEWTLISCLFAYRSKGDVPITADMITRFLDCKQVSIVRWLNSLEEKGLVIVTKDKVNGYHLRTLDFSPILRKIESGSFDITFDSVFEDAPAVQQLAMAF